jgi:hypothetical protein
VQARIGALFEKESAMKVRGEITVALENRPGALGDLCDALASQKVNVLAIAVHESANVGIVRIVVDKPSLAAKTLLQCLPMTISGCQVLELSAANKPGILAKVADKLGRKKINIEYAYGSAAGKGKASIILKPSNLEKAMKLLKGF